MRFAIEGQIDNVGAADIFLFLSQTQRTSVVSFERADQETRVFFQEGLPVWCVSTKVQLQIEARLAGAGAIKLRDIETALANQKAGSNRIPQALIAEQLASEASIERDLKSLSLDALRDVATWTAGSFTVYDGVTPPPWAFTIAADFPALLVEALRGQCVKESLQREFVSRKCILRTRSASRSSSHLNDAERVILALVNGERTVEELVKRSGLDELQALGAMHVLCALHLTDLLPPQRAAKPPERPAPPPPPPMPPPKDPATIERGGATSKYVTVPPDVKNGPGPAEAAQRIPEALNRSGESTAKLSVPRDAPQRMLRITGDDKTEDIVLTAATFAVGRHPRNDLVLKDPRISSFHCRVEIEGDKCVILDLKSRNGTLLNSARIDRSELKHNDRIQLGSTKITYLES
jgi:hypothetical protein